MNNTNIVILASNIKAVLVGNGCDKDKLEQLTSAIVGYIVSISAESNPSLPTTQDGDKEVKGGVWDADKIKKQIYKHLDSLPYAGGFPNDWKETLAKHLSEYLNESQSPIPVPEIEKKAKLSLLWELIEDWQDARELNEDIHDARFSFNDIEKELYDKMEEVDPK